MAAGDLQKAHAVCDKQRGSVANVVTATLVKYAEVENNNGLTKEQKVLAIQKELEEATALEMPMMQQNLPIIATITTLGTLFGLLGTVVGMIRSFQLWVPVVVLTLLHCQPVFLRPWLTLHSVS